MNKNEDKQEVENSEKWKEKINERNFKYSNQQEKEEQIKFFKSLTDNQ